MTAYEMYGTGVYYVTSYICFLASLITNPKDVQVLRSAGVLYHTQVSNEKVAKLFQKMAKDLVPDPLIYGNVRMEIQEYCEKVRSTAAVSLMVVDD